MLDVVTPIDRYLAEQQDSTAVERFARRHEADLLEPDARWYADRLPTSTPGVGEQYAFRVDLDLCTGCKSCVAACHSLNGLDESESWRSVGLLIGGSSNVPRQQTVPSGCHHCVDPACLSGCPTNAYEKDPFTGIVKHLDDQCFGCGYCELTCPYEVPKMNHRLGIVRKCDLCADRLADGEAPACVQACPTSAITVAVVETEQVVAATRTGALVPGAPASATTAPTTQYVSSRPLGSELRAADHHALQPAHSHPPLAVMLVLNQTSVGALVAYLLAGWLTTESLGAGGAVAAAAVGVLAVAASFTHLGRPLMAWRAFLGVRTSWMSREIVAFAAYTPLAVAFAGLQVTDVGPPGLHTAVGAGAAAAGVMGVVCSVFIYLVTRRTWWAARFTFPKFLGTSATIGGLFGAVIAPESAGIVIGGSLVALVAASSALGSEASVLRHGADVIDHDIGRTAHLLTAQLRSATRWRFVLGVAGGVIGPVALIAISLGGDNAGNAVATVAALAVVAVIVGHLIERLQFFVASAPPRMPGGFRP